MHVSSDYLNHAMEPLAGFERTQGTLQIPPLRFALSKNIPPVANKKLWVPHISRFLRDVGAINLSSHACQAGRCSARRRSLPVSRPQFGIPPTSRYARYEAPTVSCSWSERKETDLPGPHVFRLLGGPQAHDLSGREEKGRGVARLGFAGGWGEPQVSTGAYPGFPIELRQTGRVTAGAGCGARKGFRRALAKMKQKASKV